jgi:SnoaL-like domain
VDDLQQMLDRQAITDRMHAYARLVDLNLPGEVAKVFTEDCRLNYRKDDDGWFEGRAALVAWLTSALAPYSVTNHTVSNIEITFDSRDRAQASSYVQAWHAFGDDRPDVLAYGRYYDIWVRTPSGWQAKERRFKVAAAAGRAPTRTSAE